MLFNWVILLIQCNHKYLKCIPSLQEFRIVNDQSCGGEPMGNASWHLGARREVPSGRWQSTSPLLLMIRRAQMWLWGPTGGALKNEGRGAPSTPKLAMSSPQTTLKLKELAVPAGSSTLRVSSQIVLKDLLPQGVPDTLGGTKIHPVRGKPMFPAHKRADPEELWK